MPETNELDAHQARSFDALPSGGIALTQRNRIARESMNEEASPPFRNKTRIYAILSALYMVLFIAALDQAILATAVPTIASDLKSAAGYTWIGSAYLLGKAASGPIWAKCSDIWGRKSILLSAVALFAIASMIAALSISMPMLIAARGLQGVAGSALFQMVYIVIADLFSVRERSLYVSCLGAAWAVAGTFGSLLGGIFTQKASWRWCFWINLPICGLAFILLVVFLDVHNPRTKLREGLLAIDWLGSIAVISATSMLLLGLNFGGSMLPWSNTTVVCLIVIGAIMFVVFYFCEKPVAKYPLIPMSIFNDRSNIAIFLVAIAHNMVQIGQDYYLPLYFQGVKLASPVKSGIFLIPMMITEALTDVVVGMVINKTGRYLELTWIGVTILTLGTGLFITFDVDTSTAAMIGIEVVAAIGTALLVQTPTLAIQSSVPQQDTAAAMAALACIGNVATAFSVVLGGVVFQNSMAVRRTAFTTRNATVSEAFQPDQAAANVDKIKALPDNLDIRKTFAWSTRNIFILYTGLAGVAMFASVFMKQKQMSSEHVETKTGIAHLARSKKSSNTPEERNAQEQHA